MARKKMTGRRTTKKRCKQRAPKKQHATKKKKKPNKQAHLYRSFVRHVAQTSKGSGMPLTGKDLIVRAAKCWQCLTDDQKKHFQETVKKQQQPNNYYTSFP